MRLTTRQTGIISYAGLEEGALWAAAKRMFARQVTPARLLRVSRATFPVFQSAALRLSGKLEDALQVARKHDFPLEEGLALAAMSRKRNQPELLHMARAALERSQMPGPLVEKMLSKSVLEGHF